MSLYELENDRARVFSFADLLFGRGGCPATDRDLDTRRDRPEPRGYARRDRYRD